MFDALLSWWRKWRFQRKIGDTDQTLRLLRKMQQDENELVRLMATVTILKLDPTRSDELTPLIQAAQESENLAVSELAEEFIAANWRQRAAWKPFQNSPLPPGEGSGSEVRVLGLKSSERPSPLAPLPGGEGF